MSVELKCPHCGRLAVFTSWERCTHPECQLCPRDLTWLYDRRSVCDGPLAAAGLAHVFFVCSSCGECVS